MNAPESDREPPCIQLILDPSSQQCDHALVGGKARNLWLLGRRVQCSRVPQWFCITTDAFTKFIEENHLGSSLHIDTSNLAASATLIQDKIMAAPLPSQLEEELRQRLAQEPFSNSFVAVRSSGTDEDSATHSFAGQFESYLFQKGESKVVESIKRCWCSCFSERVMSHRLDCGLPTTGLKMAVVIQVMVNSEVSGVAFSRHPLTPLSSNTVLVEAVYGLGEGLVSGELEADRYEVSRSDLKVTSEMAEKTEKFIQSEEGGVTKVKVQEDLVKSPALTDDQAVEIAKLLIELEEEMTKPQDFEWAIEKGQLYCLQARPIVILPPSCFFEGEGEGGVPTLWDNSNIVESYSGVTSPLTFSFASYAYETVYTITMTMAGVPPGVVAEHKPYLSNMLGLIRGNIYYNLVSWYRCLTCLPIGDTSKYMETMMGVKQSLDPELEAQLGKIKDSAPKYSIWTKVKVLVGLMHKIYSMDRHVERFFIHFNRHYANALATDFGDLSLQQQVAYVRMLYKEVLGRWEVPIYNDTYVMLFFGMLKKLVSSWLSSDTNQAQSLQNDLLCGQGNVESTEPTKSLMRIAEYIDTCDLSDSLRPWFINNQPEVLELLAAEETRISRQKEKREEEGLGGVARLAAQSGLRRRRKRKVGGVSDDQDSSKSTLDMSDPLEKAKLNVVQSIQRFLSKYGFRCINELKLEEHTLHDDPGFVLDTIAGYVRTQSYSIANMEQREAEIRTQAEKVVSSKLSFHQRLIFNWILFHTRRSVRHRENLRFARTKLFGVFRDLFRAIGDNLVDLSLLKERQDVFYLTVEEIFAFIEGRAVTNNIPGLVELRRDEYNGYRKGLPPPERFLTHQAVGPYLLFPQLLEDLDLLRELEAEASSDPNVLKGTPCCPGVVEGTVRVVRAIEETAGLNGEILVTARTDPGWVPLYPLCSGLVIERGSLLSHSAVVARELGLPTIVGVSGGLMKRLKTGMRVHVDAGKGKITIVREEEREEDKGQPDT